MARVLILGGDGYLGWPTAMRLATRHHVCVVDNYSKRALLLKTGAQTLIPNVSLDDRISIFQSLSNHYIQVIFGDCADYCVLEQAIRRFQPDTIIHYAEQPSAPYSMLGYEQARYTLNNNLNTTLNLIWAVMEHAPDCHIIKLGSLGEYGTPDIDIEEGWLDIEHKGRKDRFLYPRQGGSLYHTTKIQDTDLLWFYVRSKGLRVTDIMQGPVYGLSTSETDLDKQLLPGFHYDAIFGTVVNRFLVQAIAGIPLTVYGQGNQTRGYLNLRDTLQCVELALNSPVGSGELRILNQFTETFSVNQLAEKVRGAGDRLRLNVEVQTIDNPRKEAADHYYNPSHSRLPEMGLEPELMTEDILVSIMEILIPYKGNINLANILPQVQW